LPPVGKEDEANGEKETNRRRVNVRGEAVVALVDFGYGNEGGENCVL
jgi:hypothetical protein